VSAERAGRTLVGAMTDPTVYLDHAATTPLVPAALEAMTAHLLEVGNPS
jgi:cysteine desulfurase